VYIREEQSERMQPFSLSMGWLNHEPRSEINSREYGCRCGLLKIFLESKDEQSSVQKSL